MQLVSFVKTVSTTKHVREQSVFAYPTLRSNKLTNCKFSTKSYFLVRLLSDTSVVSFLQNVSSVVIVV